MNNATLNLVRGQTYTFTVSASGHPFWITTARGPTSAAAAPNPLFYQCGVHDAMGGTLNISDPVAVPAMGALPLVGLAGLLAVVAFVVVRRRSRA